MCFLLLDCFTVISNLGFVASYVYVCMYVCASAVCVFSFYQQSLQSWFLHDDFFSHLGDVLLKGTYFKKILHYVVSSPWAGPLSPVLFTWYLQATVESREPGTQEALSKYLLSQQRGLDQYQRQSFAPTVHSPSSIAYTLAFTVGSFVCL